MTPRLSTARLLARSRIWIFILGAAACQQPPAGTSGTDAGAVVVDLAVPVAAGPPFIERLTSDADPGPVSVRQNLVQWNWTQQLAADDTGGVHVVYAQLATTDINLPADRPDPVPIAQLPAGRIYYKQAGTGTGAFSAPVALTTQAVGTDSPAVATAGAYVYVLYRAVDNNRLRIFFRSSSDRGKTFASAIAISDNPVGVSVSPPALATAASGDDGRVYVVWADGRPRSVGTGTSTVKEVYLAMSSDHGQSFGAARPVSKADGYSSWTPALSVFANSVHVAWTDERDDLGECTTAGNPCREEEYYRRSTDNGTGFGPELRLTKDPAGAPRESWAPSIAAWQDTVHLAYLDKRSGYFQVYYQRSLDGGTSFGTEVQIASDPMYQNAARPTIAAREADVHLAWFGFTSFEADIYYARSSDSGASFAPYKNLTAPPEPIGASRMPHVAVAPDHTAHLIWYDTRHSDASGARIELYHARPNG